jgi:DNA repair exonuclease SbcCD ATPase subunit
MDTKRELKKRRKELVKIQGKLKTLQGEQASLEERLSSLEAERKKLVEIEVLEGGVQDNLDSIRVEIIQGRERIAELDEMLKILEGKKSELEETIKDLKAQIVEDVRKRFRLEFEDKLECLAKEFKELWPIAKAANPYTRPEGFGLEISRLALKAALKTGEMAGNELLKREVAKMT